MPSCACSSTTATAPTARRRASSTCSTPGVSTSSWPRSKPSSAASWCGCRPTRCPRPTARIARRTSACMRRSQPGKVWAGVVLPVGKMTVEQMRGLAKIARELGDGDIRLTVWQNLLISGIAEENAALVETLPARDRPHRQGHQRARRASSPAPATPAASSPRPTPRTRRWRSPTGWSRAWRSTPRSTSISPAARTPAPSTTSATSACWPAACRSTTPARTRSKASTCYVGGGFGAGRRHRAASSIAT